MRSVTLPGERNRRAKPLTELLKQLLGFANELAHRSAALKRLPPFVGTQSGLRQRSQIAPPPSLAAALQLSEPATDWIEQSEDQEPDTIDAWKT
jgi:hypothetical protein